MRRFGIFTLLAFMLGSCQSSQFFIDKDFSYVHEVGETPPSNAAVVHQVFLLGDAGGGGGASEALQRIGELAADLDAPSSLVFLGDNIYPVGMPKRSDPIRQKAEDIVDAYFNDLKDFSGDIIFVPGNHDWESGNDGQEQSIKRLEKYLRSKEDPRVHFLPEDGLPGPHEFKITKDLRLIAIDSEWWLNPEGKPTDSDSWTEDASIFRADLEDLLAKNRKRNVIVAAHHPLRSNGRHAGRMGLNKHLFPLRELHPSLYIPLPLIGSLYPLYLRSIGGSPQDIAHHNYQEYIRMIRQAFDGRDDIVYAAGHEHSLQYFRGGRTRHFTHEIVSGSGSKVSYAAGGNSAAFSASVKGFSLIKYYDDGSSWVEMISVEDPEPLFQAKMKKESLEAISDLNDLDIDYNDPSLPSFADSTISLAIRPDLDWGGSFSYFWLGEHYRKGWAQELDIKVLDLATEMGGLKPIKLGGSAQTNSLRLEDDKGRHYVLRSIMKDATRSAVRQLSSEVVNRITVDQTSVLNPFGAFLVASLADGAGIYHTNPELRYVPDDPRLGVYRDKLKNQIVLFEERPDGDMSHLDSMGNPSDVISSRDLWKLLDDDVDHRVDARLFLKSRLFDHFVGDWDRHDDQWRWGAFEPADSLGKIYRPIPRDRDFAFMKMDGFLPWFARVNFLPWYQDFNGSYQSMKGLARNSPPQVRRFTSELSREDWQEIALELKDALTDEVLAKALSTWPKPIQELYSDEFMTALVSRRESLPEMADDYYELMSQVMDVVGSNKTERFTIDRHESYTSVVVDKFTKKGEFRKTVYSRKFVHSETKEIRIYGLDGNDVFVSTGTANGGPSIRLVGGSGEDSFSIENGDRVYIYDSKEDNIFSKNISAKLLLSDDSSVNEYLHKGFSYDSAIPTLSLESNRTDGLFLGVRRTVTKAGFRKLPYNSKHSYAFNISPTTRAFNLYYNGHFLERVGDWGLGLDLSYQSPTNIINFFGLGNETINDAATASFYQANLTRLNVEPGLTRSLGSNLDFSINGIFDYYQVSEDSLLFNTVQPGISQNTFRNQIFLGSRASLNLDARDQGLNPHSGMSWSSSASMNLGVYHTDGHFAKLESEVSFFFTPLYSPQITFANRMGVSRIIGDFPFFQSSTLGSRGNLRGYRSTRFAGRSAFYNNLDLRGSLFDFSNIVFQGRLGYLAFYDIGRVWADEETSRLWHAGYGVGLWTNIMNSAILSGTYGLSSDESSLNIKLGFFF